MKKALSILLVLFTISQSIFSQTQPIDLVFNIDVNIISNNAINLKWNKQVGVTNYNVLRKARNETSFTIIQSNLSVNDTTFSDINVTEGTGFEYCVQSATNPNISGYVYAACKLPAKHASGEILLVIDDTYQMTAQNEISNYKLDLIKEGWKVNMVFVSRTQSVASIKAIINAEYNTNPLGLKGVVLLGHVPVPYSGKIAPDAHLDHVGAWPSDLYYGNVQLAVETSSWNDMTLNVVSASDPRNYNVIGDGKFDISNKSSVTSTKLFVSRVDVFNMNYINGDDLVLFKQYLAKNHVYRSAQKKFNQAGVVDDNFGFENGEAFAQNGWRNFSALVGKNNVQAGDYFTSLKTSSYIWSYGCGGGWNTGSAGIGNTYDFQTNEAEGVFTMLFGSYFGDWDTKNNFLRAPIASPSSTLVSCWGGRPNWYFHTMAMGEPIGYSYLNSVNNVTTYFPKGLYSDQIHQSLQGDATLKMYVFDAPTNVFAFPIASETKIKVVWNASVDNDVIGYYVYRANTLDDEFQLLTAQAVTNLEFIDESPEAGISSNSFVYMVKAVKLQSSTTGSFYNLSPGEVAYKSLANAPLPVNLISINGIRLANGSNELSWKVSAEKSLAGYVIEKSEDQISYEEIGMVETKMNNAFENTYSFNDATPFQNSFYRIKMIDIDGKFTYSEVVNIKSNPEYADISMYPNPFNEQISINYFASEESLVQVKISDILGRILQSSAQNISLGANIIQISNLENLNAGIYFVTLQDESNNVKIVKSILK